MNKRLTFRTIGMVLLVESALMLVPLVVSLICKSDDSLALLISALLTACVGGGFTLFWRGAVCNSRMYSVDGGCVF